MCALSLYPNLVSPGVADAASHYLRNAGVADVYLWPWGRVVFVSSPQVAGAVFKSPHFHARLGNDSGLRELGMYHRGVICAWHLRSKPSGSLPDVPHRNNEKVSWEAGRKLFAESVQGYVMGTPDSRLAVTSVSIEAFTLTLHQHRELQKGALPHASSGPSSGMQLAELVQEMKDSSLHLHALDFLRCCTLRIICKLSLGLPLDALSLGEALRLVHAVTAFFKAWEYFLVRPSWTYRMPWTGWYFSVTAQHHRRSVAVLNEGVSHLVRMAAPTAPKDSFLGRLLADVDRGHCSEADLQQLVLEMVLAGELRGASPDMLARRLNFQQPLRDSTRLTHLQAAVCECMRFKPVGPVSIRRATAHVSIPYMDTSTMHKCRLLLHPGDTVIVSMAAMHRDSATFPRPGSFDLRNINSAPLPEGSFVPFGHGRKGCVGEQLAWVEMQALITCWMLALRTGSPDHAPAGAEDCTQGGMDAYTMQHQARGQLESLPTKWEVANQPVHAPPLHVAGRGLACVQRVYLVGPHGCGKTTLARALHGPGGPCQDATLIDEVARGRMRVMGIVREDLDVHETFMQLQLAIARRHWELECAGDLRAACCEGDARTGAGLMLSDRCVLDSIAYVRWRLGLETPQEHELRAMPEVQQLLSLLRKAGSLVVLVGPFDMERTRDDGVRMLSEPEETQRLLHIYQDLLRELQIAPCEMGAGTVDDRVHAVSAALGKAGGN